jgi:hypothetical protein
MSINLIEGVENLMKNSVVRPITPIFSFFARPLGVFKVPVVLITVVWLSACSISIVDAVSSEPSYAEVSELLSEAEIQQAQLQQILAPIALYPDSVLTHILIASTYPLEVAMASQLQLDNQYLDAVELMDKAEPMGWDPSVTALLAFPTVLKKLSGDLNWTQQLGEAFLEDEAHLMANIQLLRAQADQADSFADLEHLSITRENNQIIIEPARREIVYVPYYDTRVVYGNWRWRHYQPVHWTPFYGYAVVPSHRFHWGHGIRIRTNFFFSAFHWADRRVVVVNHHHTHIYRPRVHITHDHKSRRWHHKSNHRRGVAYRNTTVKKHYRDHKKGRHHYRDQLHHDKSDRHVSHADRDRSDYKISNVSKQSLFNENAVKARKGTIARQLNHRGEHVPARGRDQNSNKVVRSIKKPIAPKSLVGSDLYTIPGNKYVNKNNQISVQPNKRKRVDTPPKRRQNNDLYKVPDNKHMSGKKSQQNPKNIGGSANGYKKSPRLVQLLEQGSKPLKPRIAGTMTNSALIKSRKGSGGQPKEYHRNGSSTSAALNNRDRTKGKKANLSRSEKW